MSVDSVAYSLLTAVAARVEDLGFNLDGAVPVVIRKLPKKGETVDAPVQITICHPEYPFKIERLSFQDKNVEIEVQVVIVSPNKGDQSSNIDVYNHWLEIIAQEFEQPELAEVEEVWDTDVRTGVFLDRASLSNSLDYVGITIVFQTALAVS